MDLRGTTPPVHETLARCRSAGVTIRVRGLTFELLDAVHAQARVRSQARRLIRGGCRRVPVNSPEPCEYAGADVSDSVEYRAPVPPVVTGKSDLRTILTFPARSPKTNYLDVVNGNEA